jgi:hypothetical protein
MKLKTVLTLKVFNIYKKNSSHKSQWLVNNTEVYLTPLVVLQNHTIAALQDN